ncbi:MAG TPA: FHA domain-containing protein [Anaerolineales bacterium]|nr:FHA domain-containing protein [Anaerolineales bacterium]
MTIICPNCSFEEPDGAIFCSECGTKLIGPDGLATATIQATSGKFSDPGTPSEPDAPLPVSEAEISLHIIRTGQILPLIGRTEYTLGRISKGQSILPDIDLSPYDAYSQGVSRLHTTIKVKDNQIYIEDLGSSNGTRINNQKIVSHNEKMVQHGDVLALGRFKIQILIRQD